MTERETAPAIPPRIARRRCVWVVETLNGKRWAPMGVCSPVRNLAVWRMKRTVSYQINKKDHRVRKYEACDAD
jgi:hypothetical protein